jgi:hypothetical protein
MALTTEHIPAGERLSPATFPKPGSHRWGVWWLAVVAALAAGATLVVTLVTADNTDHVTGHALVDYGSADAAERWLGVESAPGPMVQYGSADAAERWLGTESSPGPMVQYGSADAAERWLGAESAPGPMVQYGSADAAEHRLTSAQPH